MNYNWKLTALVVWVLTLSCPPNLGFAQEGWDQDGFDNAPMPTPIEEYDSSQKYMAIPGEEDFEAAPLPPDWEDVPNHDEDMSDGDY